MGNARTCVGKVAGRSLRFLVGAATLIRGNHGQSDDETEGGGVEGAGETAGDGVLRACAGVFPGWKGPRERRSRHGGVADGYEEREAAAQAGWLRDGGQLRVLAGRADARRRRWGYDQRV